VAEEDAVLARLQKVVVVSVVLAVVGVARAQQPQAVPRPYDGIQAGLDAFKLAEERRQVNVAGQLAVNDQVRYWSGIPTSRGETLYYGYATPPAPYGFGVPVVAPANLDYAYAYGRSGFRYANGPAGAYGPLTVFEPWPYVPGDIYGFTNYFPVRQPVGQWQGQTGPNRWESHPVYNPPLPDYRPQPQVDSPLLNGTPYATPAPPAAQPPATEPSPAAAAAPPVPLPPVAAPPTPSAPRKVQREF
jgi:hypothetical protein